MFNGSSKSGICLLFIVLSTMLAASSMADDRSLFQATNAKPYVFFIVDISGSMADTTDRRNPPMSGEDPASKLYLAKRAAYEVIQEVGDSVNYGFATFNRERMVIYRKHWLYKTVNSPSFYSSIPIFPAGRAVIFGEPRNRKTGEVGDSGGSNFTIIDDTNKTYQHRRCTSPTSVEDKLLDFPKLGHVGDYETFIYYEYGSKDYKVTMLPLTAPNKIGDMTFQARLRVEERTGNCADEFTSNIYTLRHEETLTFERFYTDDGDPDDPLPFADFTDYLGIGRSGNDTSPFTMDSYQGTSACSAAALNNPADPDDGRSHRWDGNYDGDVAFGDIITYDVTPDPLNRGRELARGDMIPWDWNPNTYTTSNREEIILRLAPNLSQGETIPDFRVGRYFQDVPSGTPTNPRLQLKTEYVNRPPILTFGGTPIGGSLISFKGWYDDWLGPARDVNTGDLTLDCRQKYVILLTDGAETCESGNLSNANSDSRRIPREAASDLYDRGIRTFVVAFGTTNSETESLTDIAEEGGTGAGIDANNDGIFENPGRDKDGDGEPDGPGPITANNKTELVNALLDVFQLVQPEATSISAAAVPSVQADVADKIYLTEFTPLDAGSTWPGSLQSFVKPLPFTVDGLPDKSKKCTLTQTSSCLAWDAQDVVVDTQVKGSETDPLGFAANQRRIFYSKFRMDNGAVQELPNEEVPRQRRFFEEVDIPTVGLLPPKAYDLWRGLGLNFTQGDTVSEATAAGRAKLVADRLVELKTSTLPDGTDLEFVVGDFFHSDPLVVSSPANTTYFLLDLEGDPTKTCEDGDPNSYRCFALLHQFRRKMLFIGSNAGMLHAFDAGQYQLPPSPELVDLGEFDNGTGRELFAYVPRPVMPTLVEMMVDRRSRHQFTVDGPPVAADVFIDPIHAGVDAIPGLRPRAADREWRTVLMGGLRRGGASLGDRAFGFGDILDPDVVKPDPLNPLANTDIQESSGYYLIDITQPDLIATSLLPGGRNDRDGDSEVDIWVPTGITNTANPPACLGGTDPDGSGAAVPSGCGPLAFATPMWEFLDLMLDGTTASGALLPPLRLDEDDNGFVDLGFTWSKPVIGRLRVCDGSQCDPTDPAQLTSGDQQDRYVAVFGGGIDPLHPNSRGNWIYMVDVETGQAIYKQPVVGSVPSSPAVTVTSDGYIDRIYFGTTEGFLYRLDMRPKGLDGKQILPALSSTVLSETAVDPANVLGTPELVTRTVRRILPQAATGEGGAQVFLPQVLFDTNEDTPLEDRAIYMSPSVFFIADLGLQGVAFGTGNREDLFQEIETPLPSDTPRSERFMVFTDDTDEVDLRSLTFTPRTVGNFQQVLPGSDFSGLNLLGEDRIEGQRGWYIDLTEEERLIGEPLVLAGVLFFSTFRPNTPALVGTGTNILCEESGLGKVYGTLVTNAEGILADSSGTASRSIEVSGLITAPFAEQSATKNPPDASSTGGGPNEITPELKRLMEELRALFPENCTFPPGHRLDIKVRNQNTGLTFVVPVPICVIDTSFREI